MSFIVNNMPASFIKGLRPNIKAGQEEKERKKKRNILTKSWRNMLGAVLILAAIISGIATYAALKEIPPLGNDPNTIIWLLNIDLIILVMLATLIARRIVGLWSGRKRGLAGSHLHVRLVYTFSLLAATPAIIMTVFSAFFFHYGVQSWFSERVSTAINESQAVAEAYLEEHTQIIKADTLAMANDIDRQAGLLASNTVNVEQLIQTQSLFRNLSEAIIFNRDGKIIARSGLTFSLEFESVPPYAMRQADEGEVAVLKGANDDRVRALIKLSNFVDSYLFVGRMIDPQVLSHLAATEEASKDYADLQTRYSGLQIAVTLIFILVAVLLVFVAIWLGLILSRQLVRPITTLITTADRVRAGDLSARVENERKSIQEFDYLAKSFNRMTAQIEQQQSELLDANRKLDRRRILTETVLEGVTAGIIGVDQKSKITLANTSAINLLGLTEKDIVGHDIDQIMPQIMDLLAHAHNRKDKITQEQITFERPESKQKSTFLVRIVIQVIGEQDIGAIVTFDDITVLEVAQRKAAWADVARRIAHEIKNPLTPIQLSAERLKRKYLEQIDNDQDVFEQCTDTIIKNVEDIGHMVAEFSSFARMPEPILQQDKIGKHIKETVLFYTQAHSDISFTLKGFDEEYEVALDAQQIRQALNNLIQNAIDSIHMKQEKQSSLKGTIDVIATHVGEHEMAIIIADNGLGLPKEESAQSLVEPYVTHKEKGTGLGLAIVKKIMDDHHGQIHLENTAMA